MKLSSLFVLALAPSLVTGRPLLSQDDEPLATATPSLTGVGQRSLKKKKAGKARRNTLQARTTLINVDKDALTAEEIIFFEDTWMRLFHRIFSGKADGDKEDGNTDGSHLRSFVVEDVVSGGGSKKNKKGKDNDRNLRVSTADRNLRYYYNYYGWFDIWAYLEISCRFCEEDDDDRRFLMTEDKPILHEFESALCDALREGPFDSFLPLEDCRVLYMEE